MTDLGTFGGNPSAAWAINDLGQVVGSSNIPTELHVRHAFIYSNGVLTDLDARIGAGGSIGNDINNRGQIVGFSGGLGAFVLRGDDAESLNALLDHATGWQISDVSAINDQGQIAATGVLDGTSYAVLLTPVPEPAIVGMLALGLGVLTLSGVRRSGD
jgi:probable HAF family extracellular repeat protein